MTEGGGGGKESGRKIKNTRGPQTLFQSQLDRQATSKVRINVKTPQRGLWPRHALRDFQVSRQVEKNQTNCKEVQKDQHEAVSNLHPHKYRRGHVFQCLVDQRVEHHKLYVPNKARFGAVDVQGQSDCHHN